MSIILFKLYLTYFKIGLFAYGGGYATIPLIEQYIVQGNHWISPEYMTDIISISQMTPGPIALNAATFVGSIINGLVGSLVATFSVISPQIIILIISIRFIDFRNQYIRYGLNGIRISVAVFILLLSIKLIRSSIFINNISVDIKGIIIFIISIILYYKKISVIKIILFNILLTTIYILIFGGFFL